MRITGAATRLCLFCALAVEPLHTRSPPAPFCYSLSHACSLTAHASWLRSRPHAAALTPNIHRPLSRVLARRARWRGAHRRRRNRRAPRTCRAMLAWWLALSARAGCRRRSWRAACAVRCGEHEGRGVGTVPFPMRVMLALPGTTPAFSPGVHCRRKRGAHGDPPAAVGREDVDALSDRRSRRVKKNQHT